MQKYTPGITHSLGIATFDLSVPVENGSQHCPLSSGQYKVHIAQNASPPYATVASTEVTFTVRKKSSAPIYVGKFTYDANEAIIITWTYGDGEEMNEDWIGFYPDNKSPPLPAGSEIWIWLKGITQTYTHGIPPSSGVVTFYSSGTIENG